MPGPLYAEVRAGGEEAGLVALGGTLEDDAHVVECLEGDARLALHAGVGGADVAAPVLAGGEWDCPCCEPTPGARPVPIAQRDTRRVIAAGEDTCVSVRARLALRAVPAQAAGPKASEPEQVSQLMRQAAEIREEHPPPNPDRLAFGVDPAPRFAWYRDLP